MGDYILEESSLKEDDRGVWLPGWLSFLSGLPTLQRKARRIVAIQVFVDESGGKGQGTVFVFSAMISSAEHWAGFFDAWQSCLDESPSIRYFKMREAANRSGEFQRFSATQRNDKVKKLCLIIANAGIVEHNCVVNLDDFNATIGTHSASPMTDPYFFPFHVVIMGVGYEILEAGSRGEPFEIVFDEHCIFGPRAKAWYPVIRACMEPDLHAITPVEPRFDSDSRVLPLQACDLTAWLHRRENNEGLGEFSWIPDALHGLVPGMHSSRLTLDRMKAIVDKSHEFTPEQLAMQNGVIQAYTETFNDTWPPRRKGARKARKE